MTAESQRGLQVHGLFKSYGKVESDNIGITNINARTRTVNAVNQDGEREEALEQRLMGKSKGVRGFCLCRV